MSNNPKNIYKLPPLVRCVILFCAIYNDYVYTGSPNGLFIANAIVTSHKRDSTGVRCVPFMLTHTDWREVEKRRHFWRNARENGRRMLRSAREGLKLRRAALESLETGRLTPILKEELKYCIQTRRLAQGKTELVLSEDFNEPSETPVMLWTIRVLAISLHYWQKLDIKYC